MSDSGIVVIGGKEYLTVAKRLVDFRDKHPNWSIKTKLLDASEIVRVKATILDDTGRVMSTGYAEEVRGDGNVNKTSSLENCETGAVGRALGFIGMTGSNIASAEEMERALEQQKEMAGLERLKAHNAVVRDNYLTFTAIKDSLHNDEYSSAYEAWAELTPDEMKTVWVAPSNGGILTTEERGKMKSNGWNDARKAHHGIEEEA